jgi:hypothetical protein
MSTRALDVEIDRIVLRGMEMTPGRAEGLRIMVESELSRILIDEGMAEGLAGGETTRLQAEPVEWTGSDHLLARGLAESIAGGLRETGRMNGNSD